MSKILFYTIISCVVHTLLVKILPKEILRKEVYPQAAIVPNIKEILYIPPKEFILFLIRY